MLGSWVRSTYCVPGSAPWVQAPPQGGSGPRVAAEVNRLPPVPTGKDGVDLGYVFPIKVSNHLGPHLHRSSVGQGVKSPEVSQWGTFPLSRPLSILYPSRVGKKHHPPSTHILHVKPWNFQMKSTLKIVSTNLICRSRSEGSVRESDCMKEQSRDQTRVSQFLGLCSFHVRGGGGGLFPALECEHLQPGPALASTV